MKKFLFAFILMVLLSPFMASANNIFGYTQCYKGNLSTYPSAQKLCILIEDIGDILFVGGIALAVIFIIVGGIKYVTAGDSEDKAKSARKLIINSLIGVAIVFAAFFLIQLVDEFIAIRLTGG